MWKVVKELTQSQKDKLLVLELMTPVNIHVYNPEHLKKKNVE